MDISWKKVKEEKYTVGWRKIVKKSFDFPNGYKADYDIADDGDAVCALVLTKDNKVVLEKIYRPGPEKILLEMPGGGLEREETPQEGMERELLTEIGYKGEVEFIASVYDDAYSNRIRHCFVIRNSKKIQEPEPEEDEGGIGVVKMTLDDFKKHLKSGQLTDIEVGYLALDYLNLL